jgi:hypothetical protein
MDEDAHVLRESMVDVDAAVVGISSSRWASIPLSEASSERAANIMQPNHVDILPVRDPPG